MLKLVKESATEPLEDSSETALWVIELSLFIVNILGCLTAPATKICFFSLKLRLLPMENWELFTLFELGQGEVVRLLQTITNACSSFLYFLRFDSDSSSLFKGLVVGLMF
jgi:hypothetical protein